MTQPTPAAVACTCHRYALNEWFQGVAHPHHHCTLSGMPHPTQPHLCLCGHSWAGVGAAQCSHCEQPRPAGELRHEHEATGRIVYLCLDTEECARAHQAQRMAVYHAALRQGDHLDPANAAALIVAGALAEAFVPRPRPAEDDSATPAVLTLPTATEDATDPGGGHVARALAIVVGLLASIEQARSSIPVPMTTITYALGMARGELEWAAAGTAPHIRRPGDPIAHGEVTGEVHR